MNRFIIVSIGIIIASLSAPAFASDKPAFYVKAHVGANKMSDTKELEEELESNTKSKSEISPTFTIGTGYYVNDMIRTDLTFDYSKISFKEGKTNLNLVYSSGNVFSGQILTHRKASIYSLMVNGYLDMHATENIKIFVGAGIGIARIKEKLHGSLIGEVLSGAIVLGRYNQENSSSSKLKNNFAYSLTIGSAIRVSPKANIEVSYSWRDFGSTSYNKLVNDRQPTKNRYNGHSLSTGIRFDF